MVKAQTFIHPGGLHNQADLDRMKAKVAAGAHPWIDDWNILITDSKAQNTYTAAPKGNMGVSRQRADADAHAAYLNAMRWYISGDTTFAECAMRNLNGWSAAVNQVPTGTDIPGLIGIAIMDFAIAGEVLRLYPGWAPSDFARFKNMMSTYLYPVCHDFLTNHNQTCDSHYFANWDACNVGALIGMGVLLDDSAKFNEAVNYYKSGPGNGNINNAVYYLHPGNLGQWQESGRDQSHAQLGVGFLAYVCQIAWNQGLDLFSYSNNRLLAGAEYVAQVNLWKGAPYKPYNNCDNVNMYYQSINALGVYGNKPIYELLYNHYAIMNGLTTPNVKEMAELLRPEGGDLDHLGYGTLTFTLDPNASPYPPAPIAPAPTGVTAVAGVGRIFLQWNRVATAKGYNVYRSTTSGGPYTSIASWTGSTAPLYTDGSVSNDSTYYYVVAAINQSGTSANSTQVSATPKAAGTLPAGWINRDIGSVSVAGSGKYASVSNNTYVISGEGTGIGGTRDAFNYTFAKTSGDVTVVARLSAIGGTLGKSGIMIRESLDPGARAVVVKLGDLGWRYAGMGIRSSTGGNMNWIDGNQFTWVPVWFKLQRSGNVYTAYQSIDGVNWFAISSTTFDMDSTTCYVGFAACSGTTGALNNSQFDNVSITNSGSVPAAPSGVSATAISSHQINLSWSPVNGVTAYNLKRSTTSGGPYTTIASGLTDTAYADSGLAYVTTYYYVVTAANLSGESNASAQVTATTKAPNIPPAPTGLAAVPGNGRVVLSWNAATEATTYNVKRSLTSGGPYTTVGSAGITSYSDTGLVNGTTYYYVVSGVNITGEGANSTQISAVPKQGSYSYWNFDDTSSTTAVDLWGSRNGTLSSGVTHVAGAINNGAKFDGSTNAYITLPSGAVSTLTDFTVSGWLRLDVAANWARIFDFGSSTTSYMFLGRNASGFLRYAITTSGGSGEQGITGNTVISTGVYTHFAVTYTGTTAIMYMNGVEVGRNTATKLSPSSLGATTQNWFGRSQYTADPRLTGVLDDIRIYSRALSASEITDQVNAVAPAAPASLTITIVNKQPVLSWTASSGAASYTIKRSTVSGSSYANVATGVTGTTFTDTTVSAGGPYYYIVTARSGLFESAPSNQASVLLQPATPTNVIATSWNRRIDLGWTGSTGASGYIVKRIEDGTYTTLTTTTSLTYKDTGLINGKSYSYVVSATNASGTSDDSSPATATPVNDATINTYTHADIGSTGLTGNAGYGNVIAQYGSGADIWGSADAFHYMYKTLSGDGAIVARVAGMQNYNTATAINTNAKAGVMIRNNLNANGQHALVDITPSVGVEFIRRISSGGGSTVNSVSGTWPGWVRLVRSGSTFTAYTSADGFNWTTINSLSISMGTTVYIGTAVCSHNAAVITQAQFDTVNIATALPVVSGIKKDTATYDSLFTYQIQATNTPYHYNASGLPAGLSVNVGNGVISGKPAASGIFPVVISAANAMGTGSDTLWLVVKRNQVITFDSLPYKTYGDADFALTANASSGLPVVYTSSDTTVAVISNDTVHITGIGTTIITAQQAGDSIYNAAPSVSQSLTVDKKSQTITFNALSDTSILTADFDAGAVASSGLPVSYSSLDTTVASIVNGKIHIVGAGTTIITASQAGDNIYKPASPVSQTLTVVKVEQTITFNPLQDTGVVNPDFDPGAVASSGLPVEYSSSNTSVATIVDGKIHLTGIGTTVITASQSGNNIYKSAVPVSQNLNVYDNVPPTTPQSVTALKLDNGNIQLIWQASTDNVGVTGYYVFVNGIQLNSSPVNATSYITTAPSGDVVYKYTVIAADARGNLSDESAALLFTNSNGGGSFPSGMDILKIFPNPSGGNFTVRVNNQQTGSIAIIIYNSNGNLIQRADDTKTGVLYQHQFSLTGYSKGMYMVQVIVGSYQSSQLILIQ